MTARRCDEAVAIWRVVPPVLGKWLKASTAKLESTFMFLVAGQCLNISARDPLHRAILLRIERQLRPLCFLSTEYGLPLWARELWRILPSWAAFTLFDICRSIIAM